MFKTGQYDQIEGDINKMKMKKILCVLLAFCMVMGIASCSFATGKTKDREELREWLNGHEGILSWKLDGLTVVITYFDGKLAIFAGFSAHAHKKIKNYFNQLSNGCLR